MNAYSPAISMSKIQMPKFMENDVGSGQPKQSSAHDSLALAQRIEQFFRKTVLIQILEIFCALLFAISSIPQKD